MRLANATVSILALALVSCYSPTPPVGAPCSAEQTCPDPQTCSFGRCVAGTPSCLPIASGAGHLAIPLLPSPIQLDGDLADWPTCFITVDESSAGLVRDLGAGGRFTPGRFSLATDGARLYVGAEVTSVTPLGDAPRPNIFRNNAISVYVDGDGTFTTAAYDADAAQIVVDHANREQAFAGGRGAVSLPDVASAATTGSATFTIELSVTAATFGLAGFGSQLGFDIGLVGGDGSAMTSELVWYQACAAPACGCTDGDAAPFCDARELGTATFGSAR